MSAQELGVVVGVDESACSQEALRWAAADAAARGCPLSVATVVDLPRLADVPISTELLLAAQRAAEQTADAAARRAEQLAPQLTATGLVRTGNPAVELLELAAGAAAVVVGSHGRGELTGLLLGSVGAKVAEHAPVPVVVVRGRAQAGGPVLVGVDGSDRSGAALEYAFAHADRHGLPVLAVHVYSLAAYTYPMLAYGVPTYPMADELTRVREAAVRAAEQSLAPWTAKYPEVPARVEVLEGPAAHQLVEASRAASLLVVGTRGHGGLTGMLLGSVSHAVVRHAHCPVAVAR